MEAMLVARHHNIVVGNVNVGGGRRRTQEADGVESYLKLWTGTNERAAHWFHLHGKQRINAAVLYTPMCTNVYSRLP